MHIPLNSGCTGAFFLDAYNVYKINLWGIYVLDTYIGMLHHSIKPFCKV